MSQKVIEAAISGNAEEFSRIFREELFAAIKKKKEASTMQVTYNGFTGELVKLERSEYSYICPGVAGAFPSKQYYYDLSLYDSDKQATISFTGVKLEDVQFLGGAVSFG